MVSISKNRRNIKINAFHKKENWFSQVEMDTKPSKMLSYRYQNGFHQEEWMKNKKQWLILAGTDEKGGK